MQGRLRDLIVLCTVAVLAIVEATGGSAPPAAESGGAMGVERRTADNGPRTGQTETENLGGGVTLDVVWIEGGSFMMGCRSSAAADEEKPVHRVTLDGFWIGKYEVTQRQYKAVMDANPSWSKGPDHPVEAVSWDDATTFCRKLSKMTGKTCVLPTEAQWEYACRAGSTTEYCFGDGENQLAEYAWHSGNSKNHAHDVGQAKPNAWGLHDTHGNVAEWCADWFNRKYYDSSSRRNPSGSASGYFRVLRGGSWIAPAWYCRSAARDCLAPDRRSPARGFRVVRVQKQDRTFCLDRYAPA